jgi:hypothetical protein
MLKLWVRSSTADMDIFATLRLIDPEGRDVTFMGNSNPRVPLNEGLLRVSQRAIDPATSTDYQVYHPHVAVEPMTPGKLYEVDVNFTYPMSIVVPEGYRLALTLQGKDWQYAPKADTVSSKDYELNTRIGTLRSLTEQAPSLQALGMPPTCCFHVYRRAIELRKT